MLFFIKVAEVFHFNLSQREKPFEIKPTLVHRSEKCKWGGSWKDLGPLCDRVVFHFSFLKKSLTALQFMSARRAIVRSPNLVGFLLKEKVLFLFWPKSGGRQFSPWHPHLRRHCPWCQGQQPFRAHTYQNIHWKLGQQSAIRWNSLGLLRLRPKLYIF